MWVDELSKTNNIIRINNPKFLVSHFTDINQLNHAITADKISTREKNNLCYELSTSYPIEENNQTVFVLVTDELYFPKAKRTIIDVRSKGHWKGDIVLITIGFSLSKNFKDFYNIIEVQFDPIDKSTLLNKIGPHGFTNSDKRETTKLNQWEKLHVFDDYFMNWERVVFLDAGLRVLDDVKYLLELDYKNKILAPKDGKNYENQPFKCQLSFDNEALVDKVKNDFGEHIMDQIYFLNCIWIYDTNILKLCDKKQLIDAMNTYTLCKTNEMGIMNLLFSFKYKLWEPFPFTIKSGKILFDWCELNNPGTNWREYCYIKYPVTISFGDC
jgi:hypothetical protein